MSAETVRERFRLVRLVRIAAIGMMAVVFALLLPVAPAQQQPPGGRDLGRDLGTVRTEPAPASAEHGANAAGAAATGAGLGTGGALSYRPFIDPVRAPVHTHWYVLLIPMSFGIAVVYKAVMLRTLDRYWHEVLYLTVQIIVGMIMLGLASYLLVMKFVPFIAAH
jgi:hypothetical protein